jgi:hypothetical protein
LSPLLEEEVNPKMEVIAIAAAGIIQHFPGKEV